jgi:hypothetical protein
VTLTSPVKIRNMPGTTDARHRTDEGSEPGQGGNVPTDNDNEAAERRDVYDVLEQVRRRPTMWVRNGSLQELETMLFGYSVALDVHQVPEQFELRGGGGPFADWLRETRGWSLEYGWAACIETHAGSQPPLELFFSPLDEYRARSRPQFQQDTTK